MNEEEIICNCCGTIENINSRKSLKLDIRNSLDRADLDLIINNHQYGYGICVGTRQDIFREAVSLFCADQVANEYNPSGDLRKSYKQFLNRLKKALLLEYGDHFNKKK